MKFSAIVFLAVFLISCSAAPEQETKAPVVKHKLKDDNIFKGYKDDLDKAKDMEKEVLKAADRQKKAIDDATK